MSDVETSGFGGTACGDSELQQYQRRESIVFGLLCEALGHPEQDLDTDVVALATRIVADMTGRFPIPYGDTWRPSPFWRSLSVLDIDGHAYILCKRCRAYVPINAHGVTLKDHQRLHAAAEEGKQ